MPDEFLDDLKIGVRVQITLMAGKEVSGRVLKKDSQFVVLKKAEGGTAKYMVAALAGWEILPEDEQIADSVSPASQLNGAAPIPAVALEPISFSKVETTSAPNPVAAVPLVPAPSFTSESIDITPVAQPERSRRSEEIVVLSDIKARFSSALTDFSLTPLAPKLATTDIRILSNEGKPVNSEQFEVLYVKPDENGHYDDKARSDQYYLEKVKKELNRIKNRWDNAIRLAEQPGEQHRFDLLVQILKELSRDYWEVSAFPFNLGCVYLKIDKLIEAMDAFGIAAIYSKDITALFNLAVAALQARHRSIACYALQRLFVVSPIKDVTLWRICMSLSSELGAWEHLAKIFERQSRRANTEYMLLLTESLIFLLDANSKIDAAYELIARLQATPGLTSESFYSIREETFKKLPNANGIIFERTVKNFRDALKSQVDQWSGESEENLDYDVGYASSIGTSKTLTQKPKPHQPQTQKLQQQSRDYTLRQAESHVAKAKNLAKQGRWEAAIGELNKALRFAPKHAEAVELLEGYRDRARQKIREQGKRSSSLYRQAKTADDLDKDPVTAEHLYRQAIKAKDNTESAVKDLAMLLIRPTIKRYDDALTLINQHLPTVEDKRKVLNIKVNVLLAMERYDDAIAILQGILNEARYHERPTIMKQVVRSYLKAGQYDEAEKHCRAILRQEPDDAQAHNLLENIRLLREQPHSTSERRIGLDIFADDTNLETLSDYEFRMSAFLDFHLREGQISGLPPDRIRKQEFTSEDVSRLAHEAFEQGVQLTEDRARLYLSAAKIQTILDPAGRQGFRLRRLLRQYCAAMGDDCVRKGKPIDVARAYYAEAFLVSPEWQDVLNAKLIQFIKSFYDSSESLTDEKTTYSARAIEESLLQALEAEAGDRVIFGLSRMPTKSNQVAGKIAGLLYRNLKIRGEVLSCCGEKANLPISTNAASMSDAEFWAFWQQSQDELEQQRSQILSEAHSILLQQPEWNRLQDEIDRLVQLEGRLRQELYLELDCRYLTALRRILTNMLDYVRQRDYEEVDSRQGWLKRECTRLLDEIKSKPTKIALELIYPHIQGLQKLIDDRFEEIALQTQPVIKVDPAFNQYPSDPTIKCQMSLSNAADCAPARDVSITLLPSLEDDYVFDEANARFVLHEPLRGGAAPMTLPVEVTLTPKARNAKAFDLRYLLSYNTPSHGQISGEYTAPIDLYDPADFHKMYNHYGDFVGVEQIRDDLFVGRRDFIDKIIETLSNPYTTTSFVFHGQKRSGKSSILYHTHKKLKEQFKVSDRCNPTSVRLLPVEVTLGELQADKEGAQPHSFFELIARRIHEEIRDFYDDLVEPVLPRLAEFKEAPQKYFSEFIRDLQRQFGATSGYERARLVILFDEFTYLYDQTVAGNLPDTFMRAWKACVEQRLFSSVIAGQDYMGKFMQRFPNEFQVAQSIRIDYLSARDARQLIEEPIRNPETGESRFRSGAVERIIALTDGNPFYLMFLCASIVDYMNHERIICVTDSHVNDMVIKLIEGRGKDVGVERSLEEKDFDNLLNSGENESTGEVPPIGDVRSVLERIAYLSRHGGCSRAALAELNLQLNWPIDRVLQDLCERRVLSEKDNLFNIRVGLFKEWLLRNEKGTR